jgi:hypothetical protein
VLNFENFVVFYLNFICSFKKNKLLEARLEKWHQISTIKAKFSKINNTDFLCILFCYVNYMMYISFYDSEKKNLIPTEMDFIA